MMKTLVNITRVKQRYVYDVFIEFICLTLRRYVVDDNNSSHRVKITLSHASLFDLSFF